MKILSAEGGSFRVLFIFIGIVLFLWSLIVGVSLFSTIKNTEESNKELAIHVARANFNKDKAYRFWAADHGGVYVPETKKTPPNPYLAHIPERDIETPSGKKLTLMNPSYMMRQMMDDYGKLIGVYILPA